MRFWSSEITIPSDCCPASGGYGISSFDNRTSGLGGANYHVVEFAPQLPFVRRRRVDPPRCLV